MRWRLRSIRANQFDALAAIVQLASIRAEKRDAARHIVFRSEGSRLHGIGRIEVDYQNVGSRRYGSVQREAEINPLLQPPDICSVRRVVKVDRRAGDVEQLDEFIDGVVHAAKIGRMVHDFIDHDRADLRVGVCLPGTRTELGDSGRIINAKGPLRHGRELRSHARIKSAKRHPIFGRAEAHESSVSRQIACAIRSGEPDFIAVRRVEREGRSRIIRVKLVFIKDYKTAWRQQCAGGNAILLEGRFRIADEPATQING